VTRAAELRARFRELHTDPPLEPTPGILAMPNPWDVGSAKILATFGFKALATTSAGHAGSLGRNDQAVQRDELVEHVRVLTACVDVPFNVDAEDCFADDLDGVIETVGLLAATDAAGFSIEDWDPRAGEIRPIGAAAERVAAARSASPDLVLTARAENRLRGVDDLDDTIARLVAYREAGADVLYAPALMTLDDITRVVNAVARAGRCRCGAGVGRQHVRVGRVRRARRCRERTDGFRHDALRRPHALRRRPQGRVRMTR
jgi:2-methylisocitrate lyase-like PEP mutase family enzyme